MAEEFRARAATLGGDVPAATAAWLEAAAYVEKEMLAYAAEDLTIGRAASEYGWHYEALRRRISGDPDLDVGTPGAPRVTRGTMESLGRGRGSRRRTRAATPESVDAGSEGARRVAHDQSNGREDRRSVNNARWQSIMGRATRGRGR